MLRERLKPTNQMVQNLVDIEISYINTSHPDFKAMTAVNQFLEKKAEPTRSKPSTPVVPIAELKPRANSVSMEVDHHNDQSMAPGNRGLLSFLWGRQDASANAPNHPVETHQPAHEFLVSSDHSSFTFWRPRS